MARLIPVSWSELVRRLKKLGFEGPYHGTRHPYMMKGEKAVILPNPHHGQDISVDFLARFLRDAGISRDKWFSTEQTGFSKELGSMTF